MIFTVLMVGGFSAMSLAMNTQTDIVKTHIAVADIDLKKQQENFDVFVSTNSSNFLNVSVDNRGQNPVEISHLWITNKTLSGEPTTQFSINPNDAFVSSGSISNILSSQSLTITPDTYDVKIISSLGTIKIEELITSTSSNALRAKLVTDPPDVNLGQNVTIAMLVTNTASTSVENVIPHPGAPPSQVTGSSPPTPTSAKLGPGESVLFTWDYALDGVDGAKVTFTGYASGNYFGGPTFNSNTSSDVSTLREDETGTSSPPGGGTTDIVFDELLGRPQIFLTIPGPAGESNAANAVFGINVINPVNATMIIEKASILLMGPGVTGSGSLFSCTGHVAIESSDSWSCPTNTIMWENFVTPVSIPPFSVKSFSVKVQPTLASSISTLEAVMVQGSVFSNFGAFGKAGYQTVMMQGNAVVGNVFISDVVDSRNTADIKTSRSGIAPGSTQTFNAVFADMDSITTTYVKGGGQYIINIPKGWTNLMILNNPTSGFINPAVVNTFGDGSQQIIATLPACTAVTCMGGSGNDYTNTIQFSVTAPSITTDSMYVMYALAVAETNSNFTLGPLTEIVLQVDVP
jgi:hypothetical protein